MTPNPQFQGHSKANISPMVHPIHSAFGYRLGFSGLADPMALFAVLTAMLDIKNGHNFATGLPIDMMFGSRVGFPAELRFLP